MELKISKGKKVKKPQYKNQYKIVLNYMYGDADGDGTDEIYIDEDNEDTERFIEFLENWLKAYKNGRGGSDDYSEDVVKDWDYFTDEEGTYDDDNNRTKKIWVEYHKDPQTQDMWATLETYEITFFDANGDEYEVKVKK